MMNFIFILMYNVKIHSYVVIEVKIGKFHPSDLGQLLFYVNAIDELEKTNEDNNTIGLLLCKEANKDTCRITLKNVNIPLGISRYKFIDEIEEYLEKRLKK